MPPIDFKKNKSTMILERRRMANKARRKAVKNETRRQKRLHAAAAIQAQAGVIPAVNEEAFFEDEDLAYKVANKFCKFVKKLKEIEMQEQSQEVRNKIDELKFEIVDTLLTKFGKKDVPAASPRAENNAMNAPPPPADNIKALNDNLAKLLDRLVL